MININPVQTLIPLDSPRDANKVIRGEGEGSFAGYLNNSILGAQTGTDNIQGQDTDAKLALARSIADELDGMVDDETMMSIIGSILNAGQEMNGNIGDGSNEGLPYFITSDNKIIIPVEAAGDGFDISAVNELIRQSDIGDTIQFVNADELYNGEGANDDSHSDFNTYLDSKKVLQRPVSDEQEIKDILRNLEAKKSVRDMQAVIDQANVNNAKGKSNEKTADVQSGLVLEDVNAIKGEANSKTIVEGMIADTSHEVKVFSKDLSRQDGSDVSGGKNFSADNVNIISTNGNRSTEAHAVDFDRSLIEQTGKTGNIESVFDRTVMNQIVKKANIQLNKGVNEIKINLEPPSLGSMKLQIIVEGNKVNTTMLIENNVVKQIVESNLNQLKDALFNQGLKVEQFSVLIGGHTQSFSDTAGMFKEAGDMGWGNQNDSGTEIENISGAHERTMVNSNITGIDVFV